MPSTSPPDFERLAAAFPLTFERIVGRIGAPIFILDADHDVVLWNDGMAELTGSTQADARAADSVGEAWYQDGRRAKTLADKVLEAPRDAHREFDVARIDDGDVPEYQDRSTFTDTRGDTRHITFSASPLFDEIKSLAQDAQEQAGEIESMIVDVQDRTEGTVDSLESTERQIDDGVAEVEASMEKLDEIVDAVGEAVAGIQEVSEATDEQAASAEEIAAMVDEARDRSGRVAEEVSQVAQSAQRQTETVAEIEKCVGRLRGDGH